MFESWTSKTEMKKKKAESLLRPRLMESIKFSSGKRVFKMQKNTKCFQIKHQVPGSKGEGFKKNLLHLIL